MKVAPGLFINTKGVMHLCVVGYSRPCTDNTKSQEDLRKTLTCRSSSFLFGKSTIYLMPSAFYLSAPILLTFLILSSILLKLKVKARSYL